MQKIDSVKRKFYNDNYKKKHIDELKKKIVCDLCKGSYTPQTRTIHNNTNKHRKAVEKNINNDIEKPKEEIIEKPKEEEKEKEQIEEENKIKNNLKELNIQYYGIIRSLKKLDLIQSILSMD